MVVSVDVRPAFRRLWVRLEMSPIPTDWVTETACLWGLRWLVLG